MPTDRRATIAAALDLAAVVVFVAIGQREHDEGSTIGGIVETALPFVIGLVLGWIACRAWRRPFSIVTGLVIWPVTLLVGMVLRNVVFDRGTATAFVIVATVFLGSCLLGWRGIAHLIAQREPRDLTRS